MKLQETTKDLVQQELNPELGKLKITTIDHSLAIPSELNIKILYEVENVCAWVGRVADEEKVFDVAPVFVANETGQRLTPLTAGIVLLTDIARDANQKTRASKDNFALGNVDNLEDHIRLTYGPIVNSYLKQNYLNRFLSASSKKFIANRLARIARINYLERATSILVDKGRIHTKQPFKLLHKIKQEKEFKTLKEFSEWLGATYLSIEQQLVRTYPQLGDRSAYFESLRTVNT